MRHRPLRKRDLFFSTLLLCILMVSALCLTYYMRSRHYLDDKYYSEPQFYDDSVRAVRKAERQRRKAEYEARRAGWAAEKAARKARHEAWLDSQKVWEARRARWAQEKAERAIARERRQAHYDSLRATWVEKFPRGTVIDANEADTAQLKRIPGIGSALSRSIIRYREALGGFVSPRQVEEVRGVPAGTAVWFSVSDDAAEHIGRHLDLNRDDFRTLVRHPYLSYEQVCDIADFRRHHPILSLRTLLALPSFTDADLRRLEPYVGF